MLVSPLLAAALAVAPLAGPAPRADPQAVAALKAQAERVIVAASAQAQFADDTRWDLPAVRHRASGLRCLFQPNDAGNNRIVQIGSIGTGGGGVGCHSRPSGFAQKLEAVRLGSGESLETVFEGSVRNITSQRRDARAYEGPLTQIRIEPQPGGPQPAEARTARYLLSKNGSEVFSMVSVAVVGDWVVRQYLEAPAAQAEEADMLAGVVMSTTLIDLAERRASGA